MNTSIRGTIPREPVRALHPLFAGLRETLIALFLLAGLVWAQGLPAQALDVRLLGCDSLPLVYAHNGFRFIPVQRAQELDLNRYRFALAPGPARFLYVGSRPDENVAVIVGDGERPLLDGHCLNMAGTEVVRSTVNQRFRTYRQRIQDHRERLAALLSSRAKTSDPGRRQALLREIGQLDTEKRALLAEARQAHPLLGAYVALFTYLSQPAQSLEEMEAEARYFAAHYFDQAELEQAIYNRVPQLAEAFAEYTQTLMRLPLGTADRRASLEASLNRMAPGRPARQLAYAGILEGLRAQGFGLFAHFAGQMLDEFPQLPDDLTADLRAEAGQARQLAIGGQAPNIAQPDPEGQPVQLDRLRGKVVFVDFWASWCRPCRLEYPQLKRIYAGYRQKGFEIMGVSLDVERGRWLRAIQQDGIDWLHGSDLQGWDNAAARAYRVSAIPHNVLIDPQGRILARNLSMAELEDKLEELL